MGISWKLPLNLRIFVLLICPPLFLLIICLLGGDLVQKCGQTSRKNKRKKTMKESDIQISRIVEYYT